MGPLKVALHALRTEHAAIERELLPRLEANHPVVTHLELNPALLATEAAMGLHEPIRLDAGRQPRARHRRQVRSEPLDDAKGIARNFGHALTLPLLGRLPCRRRQAKADGRSGTAATRRPAPGRRVRAGTWGTRPGNVRPRQSR